MILHLIEQDYYAFFCPGCGNAHAVTVNGRKNDCGATWQWNGSMDKPTFHPSIHCNRDMPELCCHSFVRDGVIQFLGDCYHSLKGQTVLLPNWDM